MNLMAEDKFEALKINPSTKLGASSKLHYREHVLADDLSRQMSEPKRFAAYLGLAMRYPENILRRFASEVMETYRLDQTGKTNPGKLFFYKVGEYAKNFPKPRANSKEKSERTRAKRNKSRGV